jgi:twinkle protein
MDTPYNNTKPFQVDTSLVEWSNDQADQAALEVQQIELGLQSTGEPNRLIRPEIDTYFGVKSQVCPTTHTIVRRYYPYKGVNGKSFKFREVATKQFRTIGNQQGANPFGWDQAEASSSPFLFLVEGEECALSLFQAIADYNKGSEYAGVMPAVVSLPNGVSLHENTLQLLKETTKYKEIRLVLDNDEPGEGAVKTLTSFLSTHHVSVIRLPLNDPSDMVMAGKSRELAEACLFRGEEYKPHSVVSSLDLLDSLDEKPEYGLSWPWQFMNDLTYGIREGKIYTFGAGVSIGKTAVAHNIVHHLIKQGVKVGVFMLEESNLDTLRNIASIPDNTLYISPDIQQPEGKLRGTVESWGDLLYLGKEGEAEDWQQVKEVINYQVILKGVRVVVLDPISGLVDGLTASDANEALGAMLKELESIGMKTGCSFILNSHLNPPKKGLPHEEAGKVQLYQFTGSRAMMRKSSGCFGVERDTTEEEIGRRLTSKITCLKLRGGNSSAPIHNWVKYSPNNNQLDVTTEPPPKEGEPPAMMNTQSWGVQTTPPPIEGDIPPPWEK